MTTVKEREQTESMDWLREVLKPGTTVYTVLRHVSSSGMTRDIDLYVMVDNEPRYITWHAAKVLGYRMAPGNGQGLRVSGCGMDMGFHVVYSLSRVMFPNGHKCSGMLKRGHRTSCPSNDHSNDYGDFSRAYDAEHAPKDESKWYVSVPPTLGGYEFTDDERAERTAYQEAKSAAWEAGEAERWSKRRMHSDGGYALRQQWI